jgi:hypothetical protein
MMKVAGSVVRSVGYWTDPFRKVETMDSQQERIKELEAALDTAVWRNRDQFPNNPYCVICGAGWKWAEKHGHERSCPLSDEKILNK